MTILFRLMASLPMAIGLGLLLSTSGELLDAYQAAEAYREVADPIVEAVIVTGQAPELTSDQRFELRMGLPRAQMDRGSFESMRLRFYGGIALAVIGALIAWRADVKMRLGAKEPPELYS